MEFEGYLRFILALIFVIALIGALAMVAQRFGFGYRTGSRDRHGRRLSVVEVMPVDGRRRLVLFKRDQTEYLVLLGATTDLLIDGGATRPGGTFADHLPVPPPKDKAS